MRIASRKPSEAAPQRMAPLAKLPVFLELAGKRAVIAGGTAAAAWKAELLAAAGADVVIYAEALGSDMKGLIAQDRVRGSLIHIGRRWTPDCLAGAAVALADVETDAEAEAFHAAAGAAGVPVNVIDKPRWCQFQFGSIVNRSPVVIGISTDGAAPILGQSIRRRIEILMPSSLAAWVRLAKTMRQTVQARLRAGSQRRAFWEHFAERAFAAHPKATAAIEAATLIAEIASGGTHRTGRVSMVGAGPGDAELLTLKAVRALQSADVILFDDLVSADVLDLARREAKRMLVGKRGGRASCKQDDINALMISLASKGQHVVRLKSGDPMIFGRAGEEIAEIEAAGIPVVVVPGITAGLAMASELGASLTHRDFAHSVRFVTGHSRHGELPHDLDWRGMADPATTLVVYMAGRTGPAIAERLIAEGLARETPVVVASGVARADGTRWAGTLGTLARRHGGADADLPVLIGIGQAFARVTARDSAASRPYGITSPAPPSPSRQAAAA